MNRLVVVSNRVPLPSAGAPGRRAGRGARRADGKARRAVVRLERRRVARRRREPGRRAARRASCYATIDLTPDEHDRYYNNFSNSVLWPLLHTMPELMSYDRRDAQVYREVNARLARCLVPLLRPNDLIWVHDYHLLPHAGDAARPGRAERRSASSCTSRSPRRTCSSRCPRPRRWCATCWPPT